MSASSSAPAKACSHREQKLVQVEDDQSDSESEYFTAPSSLGPSPAPLTPSCCSSSDIIAPWSWSRSTSASVPPIAPRTDVGLRDGTISPTRIASLNISSSPAAPVEPDVVSTFDGKILRSEDPRMPNLIFHADADEEDDISHIEEADNKVAEADDLHPITKSTGLRTRSSSKTTQRSEDSCIDEDHSTPNAFEAKPKLRSESKSSYKSEYSLPPVKKGVSSTKLKAADHASKTKSKVVDHVSKSTPKTKEPTTVTEDSTMMHATLLIPRLTAKQRAEYIRYPVLESDENSTYKDVGVSQYLTRSFKMITPTQYRAFPDVDAEALEDSDSKPSFKRKTIAEHRSNQKKKKLNSPTFRRSKKNSTDVGTYKVVTYQGDTR